MRRTVMALTILAALTPLPAAAHAILMESQPAAGATLAPGLQRITMRFNSRIDAGRSRIELRGGPAGAAAPEVTVRNGPTPDVLVGEATLPPGDWVMRWQVLAVDGHITRGDVPVTVKAQAKAQ